MKKLILFISLLVTPITFGDIIKSTRTYVGKKNVPYYVNSRTNYTPSRVVSRTNRRAVKKVLVGYNRGYPVYKTVPVYNYGRVNASRRLNRVRPIARARF